MRRQVNILLALSTIAILAVPALPASAQSSRRGGISSWMRPGSNRNNAAAGQQRQQQGFAHNLNKFVSQNRLKTFTKHGKPVLATQRNTDMKGFLNLGKNVVEFFVKPGFHHLYARVPYVKNGKVEHKVFSRISGLDKSAWYPATSERVSVLAELSDKEMDNLRKFLDKASANPREVLGPFNYNGGKPPHASNCTSYITHAKVGENGESLARVLGVYESGMPQSFLKSLMSRGNDRVKAVVVQNPSGGDFGPGFNLDNALR